MKHFKAQRVRATRWEWREGSLSCTPASLAPGAMPTEQSEFALPRAIAAHAVPCDPYAEPSDFVPDTQFMPWKEVPPAEARLRADARARRVKLGGAAKVGKREIDAVVIDRDLHALAGIPHRPYRLHVDEIVHPRLRTIHRVVTDRTRRDAGARRGPRGGRGAEEGVAGIAQGPESC